MAAAADCMHKRVLELATILIVYGSDTDNDKRPTVVLWAICKD